eukprot:TRINITY_DN3360_c0_g1_i5.p1 TRINITY_DN3360_c0_g1~~TRINITY_DN3360_c0_g1_i5.p1  ORF type:complete len:190 (+),score=20.02 TRINITY_DN3360_c0_g1_i5:84-653(+)
MSVSKRDRDRRSPARSFDRFRPGNNRPERSPPQKRRREENERRDWERGKTFNEERGKEDRRRGFGGRDPQRLDGPLLSFKEYLLGQYDRPSVAMAQKRYEDYKTDYDKHNSRAFFKSHREVSLVFLCVSHHNIQEEWFLEKYHPTKILERRKRDATKAQEQANKFIQDLIGGHVPSFDADDNEELFKGM